jgi:sugar/nucleoside kinase (ribokinase family)
VADHFAREGISTTAAPRLPEAGVVRSVIVVGRDTGSRNIFFQVERLLGAHDSLPSEEVIRRARVLFIDHYGMRGNLRAARLARAHGVAVVADFEGFQVPLFKEVLALVDHLILSRSLAMSLTGAPDAAAAALALWRPDRAAVIVTCGADGCWSATGAPKPAVRHHPAFRVKAADTTGCGDVFHGAYAAWLARKEPIEKCIRFASASAALKARAREIPRLKDVQAFLARKPISP